MRCGDGPHFWPMAELSRMRSDLVVLILLRIWSWNVSFWSKVIPRYVVVGEYESRLLFIKMEGLEGRDLVKKVSWVLGGLKVRPAVGPH